MKVAVYAISLNEAKFASRFMAACSEADLVVVADTGSTDGTQHILRGRGAIVHDICIRPWRFDDARNVSLSLVPGDVDICFSLDLDEVPRVGWRRILENGWSAGSNQAYYTTIYTHLEDGSPGVTFLNDRIHSRFGFRWKYPCHEGIYAHGIQPEAVHLPSLIVDHYPDVGKSRGSYLSILKTAVQEDCRSARISHYYARELYFHDNHAEALIEFERYLGLGDAKFKDERVASYLYMAKAANCLGKDPSPYYFRSIAEAPHYREPWLGLAEHAYRHSHWSDCYAMALKGLAITTRASGYPSDPHYWGSLGNDLAAIGAWNLGLKSEALKHARTALAIAPNDPRLRQNVVFMENNLNCGLLGINSL